MIETDDDDDGESISSDENALRENRIIKIINMIQSTPVQYWIFLIISICTLLWLISSDIFVSGDLRLKPA